MNEIFCSEETTRIQRLADKFGANTESWARELQSEHDLNKSMKEGLTTNMEEEAIRDEIYILETQLEERGLLLHDQQRLDELRTQLEQIEEEMGSIDNGENNDARAEELERQATAIIKAAA